MNNTNKILQYHIENNYKRLQPKKIVGLSDKQKHSLQKQLDLHHRLNNLTTRKARGYKALESSLHAISTSESPRRESFFLKYRLQLVSFGALALIAVGLIGGLTGLKGSNVSKTSTSQSSLQTSGSLDNFTELSIQDAQADAQVSSADENAITTVKSELGSASNLEGGVYANF